MPSLPHAARAWLATHHGVISAERLGGFGLGDWALRRLVDSGDLVHLGNAIYRLGGTPVTAESLMAAACLRHPDGYVTGSAAGRFFRLRDLPRQPRIEFCLPTGRGVTVESGLTLRRSTSVIPGVDHRDRPDGIRLATPLRLSFDLAAHVSDVQLSSIVEDLLHRQLCTLAALRQTAQRLAGRGRKGSARYGRVLIQRIPGGALESGREARLAPLLARRGIPIESQVRLLGFPNGSSIRVDLAVPSVRWGVEIDVHPSHLFLAGTAADKQRDRWCHLIDWQIERVTALDFLDLDGCADELLSLYLARCAAVRRRSTA